jgi:hypothetical protein
MGLWRNAIFFEKDDPIVQKCYWSYNNNFFNSLDDVVISKCKCGIGNKLHGNICKHLLYALPLEWYETMQGECMVQWLNNDKNYTPYKSIQDFFKWFKWTWLLILKLLLF